MMEFKPGNCKILRVDDCSMMETLSICVSCNSVLNTLLYLEKSIEFYQQFTKKDNFRASDGWLDKSKKQFGVCLLPYRVKNR